MYTLSAADVDRFARAVAPLGEAFGPDRFPRLATEVVADVISCDLVTYNEVARDGTTRVSWLPSEPGPPDDVEEILERCAKHHPVIQEMARTGSGAPRAISDFLTERQFKKLELYRLLFEPSGLEDQMAIGLPAPRPVLIGIALNRTRRGWDDRDRLLANLVRPYLIQAHRSARLAAALAMATMLELDDRFGVVVSPRGRVHPVFDALPPWAPFHELFPAGRADEELCGWLRHQRGEVGPDAGLPGLSGVLVKEARGERWYLRYVATPSGSGIVVSRGTDVEGRGAEALRGLGLSRRQASVLLLLTKGLPNKTIAARLGVSLSTVKRHLEAIYPLLGVRSRAEASALAMDTLAHG